MVCSKFAGGLHISIGCQLDIVRRGNIAANRHCAVRRGSPHVSARRKHAGRLHISLGLQRNIAVGRRDILTNAHRTVRRDECCVLVCRELAGRLHISVGCQLDIVRCGNVAANRHSPFGGSFHVPFRRELASRLHRSLGLQRDIAKRRNITANGHSAACRGELHILICRNLFVCLHTSIGFQRHITFSVRSIALRLKYRVDLEHTIGFYVFYYYVTIDHGLNGQRHLV